MLRNLLAVILIVGTLVVVLVVSIWPFIVSVILSRQLSGTSTGMTDEARLAEHFQQNQAALEQVIKEALAVDVDYVSLPPRGYQPLEGGAYRPLFNTMRHTKVLKVHADEDTHSVELTMGETQAMLDKTDFGYLWSPHSNDAVTALSFREQLDSQMIQQIAPQWFLYRFSDN